MCACWEWGCLRVLRAWGRLGLIRLPPYGSRHLHDRTLTHPPTVLPASQPALQSRVENTLASPGESMHSYILGMGYASLTVIKFSFLYSGQKRTEPSGFGTKTTGLAHSPVEGYITPIERMRSTSAFSLSRAKGPAL